MMATRQLQQFKQLVGFSDQDMKFNRRGEMSPRQQRQFLRGGRGRALLVAMVGGLSAAVLAQATDEKTMTTFFTIQVINAVAFGWLAWTANMAWVKDATAGRVLQVTGKPSVVYQGRRPTLYIGDQPVDANVRLMDALDPQQAYCAYCAPYSGRLLALERQSGWTSRTSRKPTTRRKPSTTPRLGSRRRN